MHTEDLTLGFIRLNSLPAVNAVEIKNGQKYILCFNSESIHTLILKCIGQVDLERWTVVELILLVVFLFVVVGVYVNSQGCRSRKQEILWHSPPASFGKGSLEIIINSTGLHLLMNAVMTMGNYYLTLSCTYMSYLFPVVYKEPYLLVYCESALEVYDVISTKWIQTIPFRKVSQNL